MSSGVLKGEEHAEKDSESPPSKSSMVVKVGMEEERGGQGRR